MTAVVQSFFVLLQKIPCGVTIADFLRTFPPALTAAGLLVGFFVVADVFRDKAGLSGRIARNICAWSNYVSFLFCILLTLYVLFTRASDLLYYFSALLVGALLGSLMQAVLFRLGTAGSMLMAVVTALSGFVCAAVVWLYYQGSLLYYLA